MNTNIETGQCSQYSD